jgi:GGDEF domain-containing protein
MGNRGRIVDCAVRRTAIASIIVTMVARYGRFYSAHAGWNVRWVAWVGAAPMPALRMQSRKRILRRVADLSVEGVGAAIRMTCSCGIAASDMLGVWGEPLIAHADAALYRAKNGGRNQVPLTAPAAA